MPHQDIILIIIFFLMTRHCVLCLQICIWSQLLLDQRETGQIFFFIFFFFFPSILQTLGCCQLTVIQLVTITVWVTLDCFGGFGLSFLLKCCVPLSKLEIIKTTEASLTAQDFTALNTLFAVNYFLGSNNENNLHDLF